jgi:hypothetical protein
MSRIWTPGGEEEKAGRIWVPGSDDPNPKDASQEAGEEPDQGAEAEANRSESTLPPATFEFLVLSLRTQAEMHLGLISWMEDGGEEGGPPVDLPLAKHLIDLLGVLQEKTQGNLSLEEQRLLENSLTELRFRYVQRANESGRNK